MNLQHLRTFVWLRFRLRANQLKRAGVLNSIIFTIIIALAAFGSVGLFVAGVLIGLFVLPQTPPVVGMLVWDGAIAAFLFSWMIGLLTELQRTDGLSLDKFLHLPVSPFGAFLVNYVSSLFSISLLLFVAGTTGLIAGQVFSEGPRMLLALPLLAAFVLAITAVTYQFQGWLASLMTNPRRRRTVIVIVTLAFILVFQLPNLINVIRPWEKEKAPSEPATQFDRELQALNDALQNGSISRDEFQQKSAKARADRTAQAEEAKRQVWIKLERTSRIINTALPPAWLALALPIWPTRRFFPPCWADRRFARLGYSACGAPTGRPCECTPGAAKAAARSRAGANRKLRTARRGCD